MNKNMLTLATVAFLGACSSGGTMINNDGSPKGDVKWPNSDDVQYDHNQGTFPDLGDLERIRPNMTRDQLYDSIGRPHFTESFHVREWTYLFHFRTPGYGTNGVSTCQYKVLFDNKLRAQHYYWKPIDPVEGVPGYCEEKPRRYTLSADALFDFDQSNLGSITDKGHTELANLVKALKTFKQINSLKVSGHADHLGSNSYNVGLSKRRAETIKKYLQENGITAPITSHGYGESKPIVSCKSGQSRQELIACLMPNRRVEVVVDGYGENDTGKITSQFDNSATDNSADSY